jgi:hypothetical protein
MQWLRALLAVLSGFAGIRRRRAAERDLQLQPWQMLVGALLALGCLLGILLALALWASR